MPRKRNTPTPTQTQTQVLEEAEVSNVDTPGTTNTNETDRGASMSATDFAGLFEEISAEEADKALASGADKGQFDDLLEAFYNANLYAVAVPLTSGPLQGRDVTKARQSLTSARDRTRKDKDTGTVTAVHPDWNVIKIRRTKGVEDKIFLINTSLKPAS